MMEFKINDTFIGSNHPVYFIAELSANHNHDIELAIKTIRAMKQSGANAVKLQTYTPDTITIDANNEYFMRKEGLWAGKTLYELYKEAYTPWEWHEKLKQIAQDEELDFFSSPFDFSAVDFLEKLNIPAYKVASPEITDVQLIEYMAKTGKPVIISTGIAELADIELAVNTCKNTGNKQIALLQCTTAYPTPLEEVNLNTIPHLQAMFDTVVGLSDHTLGISVPIGAAALGAKIVEKHFILDRSMGGVDSSFSLEPDEFKQMIKSIREVEQAMGKIFYGLSDKLKSKRNIARSLFFTENIQKGDILTEHNVRSIRPGNGLHPKHLHEVLGRKAANSIEKGTPVSWDLLI